MNMVRRAARRVDPSFTLWYRVRTSFCASVLMFTNRSCPCIPEARPYELPRSEEENAVLLISDNFGELSVSLMLVDWWNPNIISVHDIEDGLSELRPALDKRLALQKRPAEIVSIILSSDFREMSCTISP